MIKLVVRTVLSIFTIVMISSCSGDMENNGETHQKNTSSVPVSGSGQLKFHVLHTRDHLPKAAQKVLEDAHGGFAVDRRKGQGQTYFALSGAGILRISSDLKSIRLLDTPDALKKANPHNTTIWYDHDENAYLSFPSNNVNKVYTTNLNGKLIHTLSPPASGDKFGDESVSRYFQNGGEFVPTDVEKLNDILYITTGYSELDFVLTGRISTKDGKQSVDVRWNNLTFGGKGKKPGQFGTGHGITEKDHHLHVSDRPHAEIDKFNPKGEYLSTLNLPEGSYPCDIDFGRTYSVVASLHGPDRSKGAPIYLLRDKEVVSTVMVKEDLGMEKFQHIHNAVLREIDDRLYIIAQSWNPGDFVILEQVIK